MSKYLIAEIHKAEKEAKMAIEEARIKSLESIEKTKKMAEVELQDFIEKEKEKGMDEMRKAKTEAVEKSKVLLTEGEKENTEKLNRAKDREKESLSLIEKTFLKHLDLSHS